MTTPAPQRPRTADEIEADLARTRAELTQTLDDLGERLNPSIQAARLADATRVKATAVSEQASATARAAAKEARTFADDVAARKPRALVIAGAGLALVAGVVAVAIRRAG